MQEFVVRIEKRLSSMNTFLSKNGLHCNDEKEEMKWQYIPLLIKTPVLPVVLAGQQHPKYMTMTMKVFPM